MSHKPKSDQPSILSWNCAQSFRTKHEQIAGYEADILVVPECENPATHSSFPDYPEYRWSGSNDSKGLGVFTDSLSITNHREFTENHHFLYVETEVVSVLAVWAMNNSNRSKSYIAQLYSVLDSHPELLDGETVVAGDFNWNTQWDATTSRGLEGDLGDVRAICNSNGLQSVYHTVQEATFGEEADPTFFQHWDTSKPYHIDYVFAPEDWLQQETTVSVGTPEHWLDHSDHMPLYVAF